MLLLFKCYYILSLHHMTHLIYLFENGINIFKAIQKSISKNFADVIRFLKDFPFSLLWPLLYVPCAAHLSDAYTPVMDVCARQACLTCLKSLK